MSVKRERTEGYEIKASGFLIEINEEGLTFQDDKGIDQILFSEIQALMGQEITFGIKRVNKTLVQNQIVEDKDEEK